MINVADFLRELQKRDINFYTGVPDSLLKDICGYISDNIENENHIITANEGASIGLGVGYHLATNKIPLIYMQNSGIGNAVNPLLSIADDKVYKIPMLLLIGWRGEPGIKDEPQHVKQGEVSEDILKAMNISYQILDSESNIEKTLDKALKIIKIEEKPYALLVRKNTFQKYSLREENLKAEENYSLNREDAIKLIISRLEDRDILVSTTGKTSREVFEFREELNQGHEKDFLTVGAMGHSSAIAMGVALVKKNRRVYCLDGDGSVLMHMGTLAINGSVGNDVNFKHIVLNNGAHDSVGGQPTVGYQVDFCKIAESCNYTLVEKASSKEEILSSLKRIKNHKGTSFLEIRITKGARAELGRPTKTPVENKKAFKLYLKE